MDWSVAVAIVAALLLVWLAARRSPRARSRRARLAKPSIGEYRMYMNPHDEGGLGAG